MEGSVLDVGGSVAVFQKYPLGTVTKERDVYVLSLNILTQLLYYLTLFPFLSIATSKSLAFSFSPWNNSKFSLLTIAMTITGIIL